jgi:hypothetical protein
MPNHHQHRHNSLKANEVAVMETAVNEVDEVTPLLSGGQTSHKASFLTDHIQY